METILLFAPLAGAVICGFGYKFIGEKAATVTATALLFLAALLSWIIFLSFDGVTQNIEIFRWIESGSLSTSWAIRLDRLTAIMLIVITTVSSLVHLYSFGYMDHDPQWKEGESYKPRFFAYLSFFTFAMLMLVTSDNLVQMFFGWEGVGVASYLLIGFYYRKPSANAAAIKAFIVNRVGDFGFALGIFGLFFLTDSINLADIFAAAPTLAETQVSFLWSEWNAANLIAFLLFVGAMGKSAQLILHTWLPDAMEGPTPVSALIHAATMVTAGVYLIARTHGLFALAPDILHLVGIVGGVTLVLAGFAALVQTDIKRILAYSTMSQIGYMFLALGVGAWEGAIFHLMTHAFFKALLFLASGAVIVACHHEQNIFKMGGLWKKLPLAYTSFIVGGAALAALPVLTAGFYSKDEILWEAFASGHQYLLYAGLVGAFMTSLYTFRLIFIAFHGEAKTEAHAGHGISHWLPLGVLIVLSTFIGAWIHPPLAGVLPESAGHAGGEAKHSLEIASGAIALAGILLAALLFLGKRRLVTAIANSGPGRFLSAWWFAAWGFDWVYDLLFVKPYLAISRILRGDPLDHTIGVIPRLVKAGNGLMSRTETGQLRWYAASIAAGAVLVLGAIVLV